MIDAATQRRLAGDWRGACAAADVDRHLNPDLIRRRHGAGVADRLLTDLRNLAPDLLRWHLPRCGHGPGQLREGLLVPLADYADSGPGSGTTLTLAVATPRFALAAGQRIVLMLLEGRGRRSRDQSADPAIRAVLDSVHRKSADRYCLRRHRMFWDATYAPQLERLCVGLRGTALAESAGSADELAAQEVTRLQDTGEAAAAWAAAGFELADCRPQDARWLTTIPVNLPHLAQRVRAALPGVEHAVIRTGGGAVVLRGLGKPEGRLTAEPGPTRIGRGLPVVPEAAWARPVDADLLRFSLLGPHELHPLVEAVLAPGAAVMRSGFELDEWFYRMVPGIESQCAYNSGTAAIIVRCGSHLHRVAQHDGRWQPVDHSDHPAREVLFARLGGPPNPCLRAALYLNAGRHVVDLVEPLMEHGRADEALRLLNAHADACAAPDAFVLSDGGTVGKSLDSLRENTLRLRMILSGAVLRRDTRSARIPSARRRSRKGEPARLHR